MDQMTRLAAAETRLLRRGAALNPPYSAEKSRLDSDQRVALPGFRGGGEREGDDSARDGVDDRSHRTHRPLRYRYAWRGSFSTSARMPAAMLIARSGARPTRSAVASTAARICAGRAAPALPAERRTPHPRSAMAPEAAFAQW
jgi:hypothetical protein